MAMLNAGLGGAVQTSGLAIQLKTTYNRTLLENARDKLVHHQFGKEYTLPKGGGLTMEWRKPNTLPVATTPLIEGEPPTEDTFGYSSLTVTIAQYGAFVKGSDIITVVTLDPLLDNITEEQGVQAGLTIETIERDALNTGTTVQYANGAGARASIDSTDVISNVEIIKAVRTLMVNNAPTYQGGDYAAVIHPYTWATLIQDNDVVNAINAGNNGGKQLFSGELVRWMGVRFTQSTLAKVFTGAGAAGINVYSTLFFGRNAFGTLSLSGMDMETLFHAKGSAGAADPLNQYWTKGWKCTHAIKILQESFMLRLEHANRT